MNRVWAIGFTVILAVLIIIALLGEPVPALFGGLVLFSGATIATMAFHTVPVRQRTALVICSAVHDAVLRVVHGPTTTFLFPFLERRGEIMDLGLRTEQVFVEDVLNRDQQPAILRFTVYVIHQLAPNTIPPARLGEILPNLVGNLDTIVQRWTDYYLRRLIAQIDPTGAYNSDRIERHLEHLLRGRLGGLGIAIRSVQLVVWPPAGMQSTLVNAEQQHVGIRLQARQLEAILETLSDQSEEARSLALLELARSLGHNSQTWAMLDLPTMMNADPDQPGGSDPAQAPLWPGIVHPSGRP